jgi:hypothetical protein
MADGTLLLTEVQQSVVFDGSLMVIVQNICSVVHYMRQQPAVRAILLLLLLLLNGTQANLPAAIRLNLHTAFLF